MSDDISDVKEVEAALLSAFRETYKLYQENPSADNRNNWRKALPRLADSFLAARKQRHLEEGKGDIYTQYVANVPQGRVVNKRGNGNGG
jgi:biotin-(acetyl-CoA carboxylase) ligase